MSRPTEEPILTPTFQFGLRSCNEKPRLDKS